MIMAIWSSFEMGGGRKRGAIRGFCHHFPQLVSRPLLGIMGGEHLKKIIDNPGKDLTPDILTPDTSNVLQGFVSFTTSSFILDLVPAAHLGLKFDRTMPFDAFNSRFALKGIPGNQGSRGKNTWKMIFIIQLTVRLNPFEQNTEFAIDTVYKEERSITLSFYATIIH